MGRSANHIIRETESLYRDVGELLPPGGIVLRSNAGGDELNPPARRHDRHLEPQDRRVERASGGAESRPPVALAHTPSARRKPHARTGEGPGVPRCYAFRSVGSLRIQTDTDVGWMVRLTAPARSFVTAPMSVSARSRSLNALAVCAASYRDR